VKTQQFCPCHGAALLAIFPALFALAPMYDRHCSYTPAHSSNRAVKNHKKIMVALQKAEKEADAEVRGQLRQESERKGDKEAYLKKVIANGLAKNSQ
jgi:hypothetical protein